jgi:hypothetical protein
MDKSNRSATLDWTGEDTYWRDNYRNRPYVGSQHDYNQWQPAYRYGYESAQRYQNRNWDDVERDLSSGWGTYEHRGSNTSTWEQVKGAVRDAWDRMVGNR